MKVVRLKLWYNFQAMSKAWKVYPQEKEIVETTEELVEQLLKNRGLKNDSQKDKFFNPQLKDFISDLELSGITAAKKRVLRAVERQELIIVYGDYDADGLCGTAILYHGLTSLGAKVLPYIPHREKEGYGLSKEGLDNVKDLGAELVITVDHGIVALEQAKYAQTLGLDLIITDHHQPVDKKPEALSIIHSTKMSGSAVGWCLVRDLISEEKAEDLLDLVAIATICDLMPLVGVNRALVKDGLKQLNKTKRVGLLALFLEAKLLPGDLGAYEVGHILGPRLNAIGRLEHSIDALRLLCTKDVEKARKLARLLSESNDLKKQLTQEAISEAREMVVKEIAVSEKKILVLSSENWIPGIIGLVAGRISEEYKIPAIVIAQGEEESKGSARSVNGLNIVEVVRSCSDLLLDVGGHPGACGFSIKTEKIETFKIKLGKVMEKALNHTEDVIEVEAIVSARKVSKKMVDEINKFEPFGVGNQRPILVSYNVRLSDIRTVGNGQHLKMKADGVEAIAFGLGDLKSLLSEGQLVSLAYFLELDKFNGSEKLQLKVLDMQLT